MSDINFVAEMNSSNLKLFKQDCGIIVNTEIDCQLKKTINKVVNEQHRQKVVVVASPGASEDRTAGEKALLYSSGFPELIYLQPTVALAAYFGYKFNENMPVMSVVIGEDSTDIAIILADKILYSGVIDIGSNSCIAEINDFIVEKYKIESNFDIAKDTFFEIGSLLPKDSRFSKFPEFIIKAEQVRGLIYPYYEKIIGAINHLLSEASVDVIRQINNTGVIFGGVGTSIRGLSEAMFSMLGLQSLIAEDEINATILGAGVLLDTPKLLLKLAYEA